MHHLRIASILDDSIVDGPGLRLVVFTQGCPHKCPGCHNPETHDLAAGRIVETAEIINRYKENPLLSGITFSGGEPFLQAGPLAILARAVHSLGGDVVTYTGYVFENLVLKQDKAISSLLDETDILVDGPYVESLRSLELLFRGSSNQRLLNKSERLVLLEKMRNADL